MDTAPPPSADTPCSVCGAPASVQHFPGRSPTSGIWCERHLNRLRWLHPLGQYGQPLWLAAMMLFFFLMGLVFKI